MITNDVLIVNDSKLESIILKDLLKKLGMNGIISNEYTILTDLKKIDPAMVVVNYIMEDITGEQLIEEIKIRYPEIVCILASSSDLLKSQFKGFSIDDIVKIPIDQNKLKGIIEKYIINKKNICFHCKKEIQEDFYICPYCGEKLKERA
ncbi:MAG: response regulator [Marinisporobacter sp.]|jgi:two-component system chemotaxis response regulator CheY|nr:response regulator [Marinisporobacter sp.]